MALLRGVGLPLPDAAPQLRHLQHLRLYADLLRAQLQAGRCRLTQVYVLGVSACGNMNI